jgi:hypothetical protein
MPNHNIQVSAQLPDGKVQYTLEQAALPLEKKAGTHCTGGRVGPSAHLVGAENFVPAGFDPRTVHSVASHYTDYAILAHKFH